MDQLGGSPLDDRLVQGGAQGGAVGRVGHGQEIGGPPPAAPRAVGADQLGPGPIGPFGHQGGVDHVGGERKVAEGGGGLVAVLPGGVEEHPVLGDLDERGDRPLPPAPAAGLGPGPGHEPPGRPAGQGQGERGLGQGQPVPQHPGGREMVAVERRPVGQRRSPPGRQADPADQVGGPGAEHAVGPQVDLGHPTVGIVGDDGPVDQVERAAGQEGDGPRVLDRVLGLPGKPGGVGGQLSRHDGPEWHGWEELLLCT